MKSVSMKLIKILVSCAISLNIVLFSGKLNALSKEPESLICDSLPDLVEKVTPAVVNISTTQKMDVRRRLNQTDNILDLFRDFLERDFSVPEQMRKMVSLGSGFIISTDGYIATNYHVIEGAEEINVVLESSRTQTLKAKLIGYDIKTDLALLKIDTKEPLPYLEFGDSDSSRVGEKVIAIGNPFGMLGNTVTAGIISAKARHINNSFDDYIQTDAAINRGNSGGPLCNMKGKVIGINSVIVSPSGGNVGIGLAIPSSTARSVLNQLKEKGSVTRGMLGVKVQMVDKNVAEATGMDKPKGALVASINKDGAADKAKIKIGDIIVKFNGYEIATINKLQRMVSETEIGKKVPVEVIRDGKLLVLEAIIEKAPLDEQTDYSDGKTESNSDSKTVIGITVKNITDSLRRTYNIGEQEKGVVITAVDPNSLVAFAGIKPGDVIVSIVLNSKQQPINDIEEFEKYVSQVTDSGISSVMMLVSRKGSTMFVTIESKVSG